MLLAGLTGLLVVPAEAAAQTADQAGDATRGKGLYLRYCAGCHGPDGRGGAHTFMPHIGNLARKEYVELLPDDHLRQVILDGGASVGLSSYMPAWRTTLSDQDVSDIIAFIRRLTGY